MQSMDPIPFVLHARRNVDVERQNDRGSWPTLFQSCQCLRQLDLQHISEHRRSAMGSTSPRAPSSATRRVCVLKDTVSMLFAYENGLLVCMAMPGSDTKPIVFVGHCTTMAGGSACFMGPIDLAFLCAARD
jgi:hypothetical protein